MSPFDAPRQSQLVGCGMVGEALRSDFYLVVHPSQEAVGNLGYNPLLSYLQRNEPGYLRIHLLASQRNH